MNSAARGFFVILTETILYSLAIFLIGWTFDVTSPDNVFSFVIFFVISGALYAASNYFANDTRIDLTAQVVNLLFGFIIPIPGYSLRGENFIWYGVAAGLITIGVVYIADEFFPPNPPPNP